MDDRDDHYDQHNSGSQQLHLPLGPSRGYKSRSRTRHLDQATSDVASPASTASHPMHPSTSAAVHGQNSGSNRPPQGIQALPTTAAQHMVAAADAALAGPAADSNGFKAPAPIHPITTAAAAAGPVPAEPRAMKPTLFGYLGRLLSNPAKALSRGGASSATAGSATPGSAGEASAGHSSHAQHHHQHHLQQHQRPSLGSFAGSGLPPRHRRSIGLLQQEQLLQQDGKYTGVADPVNLAAVAAGPARLQVPGASQQQQQQGQIHQQVDHTNHMTLPLGPQPAAAGHGTDTQWHKGSSSAAHSNMSSQQQQPHSSDAAMQGSAVQDWEGSQHQHQHHHHHQQQQQHSSSGIDDDYQDPCLHHTHGESSVKPIRTTRRTAAVSAEAVAAGSAPGVSSDSPPSAAGATNGASSPPVVGSLESYMGSPACSPAEPPAAADSPTSPPAFATPGVPVSAWQHAQPPAAGAQTPQSPDAFTTPGAFVKPGGGMWQEEAQSPTAAEAAAIDSQSQSPAEFATPGPVYQQNAASPIVSAAEAAESPALFAMPGVWQSSVSPPTSAGAAAAGDESAVDWQDATTPSARVADQAGYAPGASSPAAAAAPAVDSPTSTPPPAPVLAPDAADAEVAIEKQHVDAATVAADQPQASGRVNRSSSLAAALPEVPSSGLVGRQLPSTAIAGGGRRQHQQSQDEQQQQQAAREEDTSSEGGEQFEDAQEDAFAADPLSPQQQHDMQRLMQHGCFQALQLHGTYIHGGYHHHQQQQQQWEMHDEGPEMSTAAGGRAPSSSAATAAIHPQRQRQHQHPAAATAAAGRPTFSMGVCADSDTDEPLPSNAMPGWPSLPLGPQARAAVGLSPECSACHRPNPMAAAAGYHSSWQRRQQLRHEVAADGVDMGVDWYKRRLSGLSEPQQPVAHQQHRQQKPVSQQQLVQQQQGEQQQSPSAAAGAAGPSTYSAEGPEASLVTALEHQYFHNDELDSQQQQPEGDHEHQQQQGKHLQQLTLYEDLLQVAEAEAAGTRTAADSAGPLQAGDAVADTGDCDDRQQQNQLTCGELLIVVRDRSPNPAAVGGTGGVLLQGMQQQQQLRSPQQVLKQQHEAVLLQHHIEQQQQQPPAYAPVAMTNPVATISHNTALGALASTAGAEHDEETAVAVQPQLQQTSPIVDTCRTGQQPGNALGLRAIQQQQNQQLQQKACELASKADMLLLQAQLQLQRSQQQRGLKQAKPVLWQQQDIEGIAAGHLSAMPAVAAAKVGADTPSEGAANIPASAPQLQLGRHTAPVEVPVESPPASQRSPAQKPAVVPLPTALSVSAAKHLRLATSLAAADAAAGSSPVAGYSLLSPSRVQDGKHGPKHARSLAGVAASGAMLPAATAAPAAVMTSSPPVVTLTPAAAAVILPTPASEAAEATLAVPSKPLPPPAAAGAEALTPATSEAASTFPQSLNHTRPEPSVQQATAQLPLAVVMDSPQQLHTGHSPASPVGGDTGTASKPSSLHDVIPDVAAAAASPAVGAPPAATIETISASPTAAATPGTTTAAPAVAAAGCRPLAALSPQQLRVLAASVFADMAQQPPATAAASLSAPAAGYSTEGPATTEAEAGVVAEPAAMQYAETTLIAAEDAICPAAAAAAGAEDLLLADGPPTISAEAPVAREPAPPAAAASSTPTAAVPTSNITELPLQLAPEAPTHTAAQSSPSLAAAAPCSAAASACAPLASPAGAAAALCMAAISSPVAIPQLPGESDAAAADAMGSAKATATAVSEVPHVAGAGTNEQGLPNMVCGSCPAAGEQLLTMEDCLVEVSLVAGDSSAAHETHCDCADESIVAAAKIVPPGPTANIQLYLPAPADSSPRMTADACEHSGGVAATPAANAAGQLTVLQVVSTTAAGIYDGVDPTLDASASGMPADAPSADPTADASEAVAEASAAATASPGLAVAALQAATPAPEAAAVAVHKTVAAPCSPAQLSTAEVSFILPEDAGPAECDSYTSAAMDAIVTQVQLATTVVAGGNEPVVACGCAQAEGPRSYVVAAAPTQQTQKTVSESVQDAHPAVAALVAAAISAAAKGAAVGSDSAVPDVCYTAITTTTRSAVDEVQQQDVAVCVADTVSAQLGAAAGCNAVNGIVTEGTAAAAAGGAMEAEAVLTAAEAEGGPLEAPAAVLAAAEAESTVPMAAEAQAATAAAAAVGLHTPILSPSGTPCGTPLLAAVQQSLLTVDELVDQLCHSDSAANSPAHSTIAWPDTNVGAAAHRLQHVHLSRLMLTVHPATAAAAGTEVDATADAAAAVGATAGPLDITGLLCSSNSCEPAEAPTTPAAAQAGAAGDFIGGLANASSLPTSRLQLSNSSAADAAAHGGDMKAVAAGKACANTAMPAGGVMVTGTLEADEQSADAVGAEKLPAAADAAVAEHTSQGPTSMPAPPGPASAPAPVVGDIPLQQQQQQQHGTRVLGSRARQLILADLAGWFDEGNEQRRHQQLQAWRTAMAAAAGRAQQLTGADSAGVGSCSRKRGAQWLQNMTDTHFSKSCAADWHSWQPAAAAPVKRARCCDDSKCVTSEIKEGAAGVLALCNADTAAPGAAPEGLMLPGFLCALMCLGVSVKP